MQSAEDKVLAQVDKNREELVEFLRKLVSIPSVTGQEGEVQGFIADFLRERLSVKVDVWEPSLEELSKHPGFVPVSRGYEGRPNVVGVYKGSGGGRSLLFNGHVDVIPVGDESSWKHQPWRAEVKHGVLYGRGASDMKSGLAAYTFALLSVLDAGLRPRGDVILEYTVDEELSGNGTLAAILRGYRADAGISGETSSMNIQPACIGRIWFEIEVRGTPVGIQRKWEGVNAIHKGYKVVQAVDDFEAIRLAEVRHPLYPNIREAIPCLVGIFEAGSYPSAFPDKCLLKGSLATVPNEDSDQVKKRLREHIETVAKADPWLRNHPPELRFKGYFAEPSEIPVDSPIVRTLSESYREVLKQEPVVSGRLGAADTRFLNKYGQTPT
ncbi:MAG: ArgE/DapE family deacylase, partial [Candidatus Caldarchaeum sp.]|nr:ArgE/DapE family deacylase [Candidatus Caldarchaeum sp.]